MSTKFRELPKAATLEMLEYVTATAAAKGAATGTAYPVLDNVRKALVAHRMEVLLWAISHGAKIPPELMADGTHPQPGQQVPDRAIKWEEMDAGKP